MVARHAGRAGPTGRAGHGEAVRAAGDEDHSESHFTDRRGREPRIITPLQSTMHPEEGLTASTAPGDATLTTGLR